MSKPKQSDQNKPPVVAPDLPLSALLSQVLVAFTVELDNEFERAMHAAQYLGDRVSLVVWLNLLRFVPTGGITVRELLLKALAEAPRISHQLGCLERWRFVSLGSPGSSPSPFAHSRTGWGSGRGIKLDWIVRPTKKGAKAAEIWPPLLEAIEKRWRKRFGAAEVARLSKSLQALAEQFEMELPHGFAEQFESRKQFPPRTNRPTSDLPLAVLLSQVLTAFALEFGHESPVSLALCASTIRVLSENPTREADIPRLTGSSPETSGIGWQHKPFVVVEPDPTAKRGRIVRLTDLGLLAQKNYYRLTADIQADWEERFGKNAVGDLRGALDAILHAEHGDHLLIAEGLIPPEGTVRAGDLAPALGRADLGAAAKTRARDLMAQTEAFVKHPLNALPHYPLWDMNRGFGP